MSELIILDVGHGNAALLIATDDTNTKIETGAFDAAPGAVLIEAIRLAGLTTLDHLFISHADADHAAGVIALLALPWLQVRNLYINPDSTKLGINWERLRVAVNEAVVRNQIKVHPLVSDGSPILIGDASIKTLAPSWAVLLSGPGGKAPGGNNLTSNSASAVLALDHHDHRTVIFSGDMNGESLDRIVSQGENLSADILLFPHHGGLASTDTGNFSHRLAGLVTPKLTLFSLSRRRFENPRPEVISAVLQAVPETHILCTQLSKLCANTLPRCTTGRWPHLNRLPAAGEARNECCGGSVLINLDGTNTTFSPFRAHQSFVNNHAPTALCRHPLTRGSEIM